jgi:hypothetical protein
MTVPANTSQNVNARSRKVVEAGCMFDRQNKA